LLPNLLSEIIATFVLIFVIGAIYSRLVFANGPAPGFLAVYAHAILPISGKGTWFMRRLAERPANLWFVVRNLFNFH
jgi:glycerol uptake facilitator-like aquaporin